MKLRTISTLLALAALSAIHSSLSTLRAQGSLTPPAGAPAPVMKSLDQIEARTPVNTLPGDGTAVHIVSQPGSYYLTANVAGQSGKAGILILTNGVAIDLNGFAVDGVAGATIGISLSSAAGPVSIHNGRIRSWTLGGVVGLNAGHVSLSDLAIRDISAGPGVWVDSASRALRLNVYNVQKRGIRLGAGGVAEHCEVENFGAASWTLLPDDPVAVGIDAGSIRSCAVRGYTAGGLVDGATGIDGKLIEDCQVSNLGFGNTMGYGIQGEVVRGCSVTDLSGTSEQTVGLSGTVIENNFVRDISDANKAGIVGNGYQSTIVRNVLIRCGIESGPYGLVADNRVGGVVGVVGQTRGAITVSHGTVVRNNVIAPGNYICGILVEGKGNRIEENTLTQSGVAQGSGNSGIRLGTTAAGNRIEGNTVQSADYGIYGTSGTTNNLIIRNSFNGVTFPITLSPGQQMLPAVISADDITSASPWANFSQP